tara:strand:- start:77 stop:937 length:861 start_codon:yes stop_codon:yes gene_type:complete
MSIKVKLNEKKKYVPSFYKAKENRADYLISKGVPEEVAYGVADKQMAKKGKKKKDGRKNEEVEQELEQVEEKKSHHPKPGRNKKYFGGSFYDFGLLHGDESSGSAGDAGGDGGGDGNRDEEEEQLDEKRKKKRKKKKKKKGKKDACYHKVRARYDVWPSAYASGALVKCRKVGAANWGNKSKTNEEIEQELELDVEFLQEVDELLNEKEGLHKWFSRKGAKGSKGGWVDCNAPDGKGGYKACGRSGDEKRKRYPACRPTAGQCKKKKGSKGKSWGKKDAKSRGKKK